MNLYKSLVRPLFFRLDPETAHQLSAPILASAAACRLLAGPPVRDPRLAVQLGSLHLASPVGLAPGFDKHADLLAGLSRLGFGYLVPGTVMPEPRAGNPRTRIVRLPEQEAMLNCMGLPSKGFHHYAGRLARRGSAVPVVASIGAPDLAGFVRGFELLQPLADAVEVNLKCNNNRDDPGENAHADGFERIVAELAKRKTKPLFVKINNYDSEAERQERLDVVERAVYYGADGFSTPSTWRGKDARLSIGEGNWSGRPLFERTLRTIRDIAEATHGRAAIRARGGIFTGAEAFAAIAAGATTVELLTAFVYEGWSLPNRINRELLSLLEREKIGSLAELRGSQGRVPVAA